MKILPSRPSIRKNGSAKQVKKASAALCFIVLIVGCTTTTTTTPPVTFHQNAKDLLVDKTALLTIADINTDFIEVSITITDIDGIYYRLTNRQSIILTPGTHTIKAKAAVNRKNLDYNPNAFQMYKSFIFEAGKEYVLKTDKIAVYFNIWEKRQ